MLDLISELEDAVNGGSSEKRVSTLRQVTDLFLQDEERLSEDQVKVFDQVLCVLVTRVESRFGPNSVHVWRRPNMLHLK